MGTTSDGLVSYAVDWDAKPSSYSASRAAVVSLTPVKDHPVWQSTDASPLVCPRQFLMSRRHYILTTTDLDDKVPGTLLVNVSGGPASKAVGELWVRYTVEFLGPRKPPS